MISGYPMAQSQIKFLVASVTYDVFGTLSDSDGEGSCPGVTGDVESGVGNCSEGDGMPATLKREGVWP